MLEIIVRIVVAGCLMVGSAHLPLNGLQAASAAPAKGAAVQVGAVHVGSSAGLGL